MPSGLIASAEGSPRGSVHQSAESTPSRGGQKGHPAYLSALSDADQINTVTVKKVPAKQKLSKMIKEIFCTHRTQEIDYVMQNRLIETRYYIDSREGKELPAWKSWKRYRANAVS